MLLSKNQLSGALSSTLRGGFQHLSVNPIRHTIELLRAEFQARYAPLVYDELVGDDLFLDVSGQLSEVIRYQRITMDYVRHVAQSFIEQNPSAQKGELLAQLEAALDYLYKDVNVACVAAQYPYRDVDVACKELIDD